MVIDKYCDIDKKIENIVTKVLIDASMTGESAEEIHVKLDTEIVKRILDDMERVLFPFHFGKEHANAYTVKYELGGVIEKVYTALAMQTTKSLKYHPDYKDASKQEREARGDELALAFLDKIPQIREYMISDLAAAFEGDPAAVGYDEIVYCYPGFYAIFVNRVAHELYKLEIPLLPRIMSEHAHSITGIDIHPGATIGKYFFIDHGTGVVIGETTIIGEHVKIYQGVTLGGLSTRAGQQLRNVKRHPTIKDYVTIYSNASILGGDTVIGENCVIGGNSFITSSVEPNMRVSTSNCSLSIKPDRHAVTDTSEQWSENATRTIPTKSK